ncbi:Endonuclease/exonuclease/phosphatase [Armillaria novae-zelandiae]|uniref:Endonuclease/exonuclease/phosphatase n=1 Tax=Armillaria novae-zelandiae TaxID=153914 RepID=A0AA39NSF0_9AGAR|nr:Endonuclease/exonuclease/phosphatase [Armillaria novae-zelandiae]
MVWQTQETSQHKHSLYGTDLAFSCRGSDVPADHPSSQDENASSDSREPAPEFLEDGAVDWTSPSPPDNERNMQADPQDTSFVSLREPTPVRSGRHRRHTGQRCQSSFSTNSHEASPPIDEPSISESGHAMTQRGGEPYSHHSSQPNDHTDHSQRETNPSNSDRQPQGSPMSNRQQRREASKKGTKAAILVSCLNINGFSAAGAGDGIHNSKWGHINQLLRTSRTGILVVSEAHLTERQSEELENLFARRMKIRFTANPDNPTGKGGVAIVINKQLTNWQNIQTKEIVPGRALLLRTKWHDDKNITILGVYALNVSLSDSSESTSFFTALHDFFTAHPEWRPNYLGGDLNFVEDAIDRIPMCCDNEEVCMAFDKLKELLGLWDGWRNTFPDKLDFTYCCNRNIRDPNTNVQTKRTFQSRIDRIYVTDKLLDQAWQWKIQPVGIAGVDHDMVSVQIAHEEAPIIGKGRWACPDYILKDEKLAEQLKNLGIEAQEETARIKSLGRSNTANPQITYQKFITEAMHLARERE